MTHDQVRQLVRRINPIPDLSMLESVDAPVLDMERSMDMQVDERPVAEVRTRDKWRGPLIGIAAAVMVLIGGLVFFASGEDDVATPAPNAIEVPGDFEPIDPGAYYVDTDGEGEGSTRGTFVISVAGWEGLESGVIRDPDSSEAYVSLLLVEVEEVYTSMCETGNTAVAADSTPEGLANQFANNGAIVRDAVTPITAFGYDGFKLVTEVPAGCAGEEFQAWIGGVFAFGGRYYQTPGQDLEYWFLDVEGTTVMVEATRPPESDEGIVTDLNASLDGVLQSLVITP